MLLRDIAHARAGDKGDISNISVIVFDSSDFPLLLQFLTPARVKAHFHGIVRGQVLRYALPHLGAFNFVMHGALAGGVTRSLALDAHGKCLSSLMLNMVLPENE